MLGSNKDIFRQGALEKLSSPEQLDKAIKIIAPRDWWWLGTLGITLSIALIWSILGRIPITVQGQGILLRSRSVSGQPLEISDFEAPGEGRLTKLLVKEGDLVQKGQVIGEIDQPDLRDQLQSKRLELRQLQAQNTSLRDLEARSVELSQKSLSTKRYNLKSQIQSLKSRSAFLREQKLSALKEQQWELQDQLKRNNKVAKLQQDILKRQQPLVQEGAISKTMLIQSEQELVTTQNADAELLANIQQLNVDISTANEEYLITLDRIADLRSQISDLDSQSEDVVLQNQTRQTDRQIQIQAVRREITQLEANLKQRSQIISPYDGSVLSVFVPTNQIVSTGKPLGQIRVKGGATTPLKNLVYFTDGDGKRIAPGMKVAITPDTVKREEYGGIVGRVLSVSSYPVSQKSAEEFVEDEALAETLTSNGRNIEVFVQLQAKPDSPSGYLWTASRGPTSLITSGTTTTTQVTVEERAPISFILPVLRKWTGLY